MRKNLTVFVPSNTLPSLSLTDPVAPISDCRNTGSSANTPAISWFSLPGCASHMFFNVTAARWKFGLTVVVCGYFHTWSPNTAASLTFSASYGCVP